MRKLFAAAVRSTLGDASLSWTRGNDTSGGAFRTAVVGLQRMWWVGGGSVVVAFHSQGDAGLHFT